MSICKRDFEKMYEIRDRVKKEDEAISLSMIECYEEYRNGSTRKTSDVVFRVGDFEVFHKTTIRYSPKDDETSGDMVSPIDKEDEIASEIKKSGDCKIVDVHRYEEAGTSHIHFKCSGDRVEDMIRIAKKAGDPPEDRSTSVKSKPCAEFHEIMKKISDEIKSEETYINCLDVEKYHEGKSWINKRADFRRKFLGGHSNRLEVYGKDDKYEVSGVVYAKDRWEAPEVYEKLLALKNCIVGKQRRRDPLDPFGYWFECEYENLEDVVENIRKLKDLLARTI